MFFFKNGRNKESNKNEVECLVVEPLIQEIYKMNKNFFDKKKVGIFAEDVYSAYPYIAIKGIDKKEFEEKVQLPLGYYFLNCEPNNPKIRNKGNTELHAYNEFDVIFI